MKSTMSLRKTVGSYLKRMRLENDVTQKELAYFCKCTPQAIANFERGACLPTDKMLKIISKKLNCQQAVFALIVSGFADELSERLGL